MAFTNFAGDEESYNIFRWYRAGWGRYTQADPVGIGRSKSLFEYGRQNPITWIDPTGLSSYPPLPDCKGLGCAACCIARHNWGEDANKYTFRYSHAYELGATVAGALAGAAATRNLIGEIFGAAVAGLGVYGYLHHAELAAEAAVRKEYEHCMENCKNQDACLITPPPPNPPTWQRPGS